jgi:holliday junction DNA helicase RuvB
MFGLSFGVNCKASRFCFERMAKRIRVFGKEVCFLSRETIISGEGGGEDLPDRSLRPTRLADMIGQREVIEQLLIALDAARKRNEPLAHILFDGPPGLGKTTFATVIPRELGVNVEFASGPSLKAPKDAVPYLTNATEGSVLFIDEIHRIPKAVEEYLYTAMEDFRIDMVLGDGINARTYSLPLNRFTMIGATTRAGLLSGPLRDRFPIRHHLGFYSVEELTAIVRRNSTKLGMKMDQQAAIEVARRSRGTPRIANNRLLWVRDFADSRAGGNVDLATTQAALKMAGIDLLGLDLQDRKYLDTLIRFFGGGPTGIEAIAHTMNVAVDTLTDEVEPFLLRSELIMRSPRGRMATPAAFSHLNLAPPSGDSQSTLF